MKTGFFKVLALGLLCSGSAVFAETIATADLPKIVSNLPDLEKIQEELQKDLTLAQGKLKNKKVQLDAKLQEFESYKDTMSTQKLDKMRKEIIGLQRELKYLETDLREDLSMQEQEQKNLLVNQAVMAVREYASKNKIDYVFMADQLIYAPDSKDITDAVIKSVTPIVIEKEVVEPADKATPAETATPAASTSSSSKLFSRKK